MEDGKYTNQGKKYLSNTEKRANHFIDWMYEEIKPYVKGNIFEVGSGTGIYSKKIVKDFPKSQIILSDIDPECVEILTEKFLDPNNVNIICLDLSKPDDFNKIKPKINTVVALNVLEHVKDDIDSLNNIYNLLEPGGKLILLVPAHKFLFNCIDVSVDHYRRYTKKELISKISQTNFKIKKVFYFNFLAILGWFVTGNILKKKINDKSVGFFNYLVPVLRPAEKYLLRKKIGISLIAILEK